MKRVDQYKLNCDAIYEFKESMKEVRTTDGYCRKLRSCKVYVYETENYYILCSYQTYVACINKNTKICYDVLRREYNDADNKHYSKTSIQHIAKFKADYHAEKTVIWRQI